MGIDELTNNITRLLPAMLRSDEAWLITLEDFANIYSENRIVGYLFELTVNCHEFPKQMFSFLDTLSDKIGEDFEDTLIELSGFHYGIWHESKSAFFESSFIFYNLLLYCFSQQVYLDFSVFQEIKEANMRLEFDWESRKEDIYLKAKEKMASIGYNDLDSIARLSEIIFIMVKKCDIFSKTVESYRNESNENGYLVAYLYSILILFSDLISHLYQYEVEWMQFYHWVKKKFSRT